MLLHVIGHILRTIFLICSKDQADAGTQRNPKLFHSTHRIQRCHSRPLVIRGAAADQLVGLRFMGHLKGLMQPALPCRYYIQMCQNAEGRLLCIQIGAAGIIVCIFGCKTVFLTFVQH